LFTAFDSHQQMMKTPHTNNAEIQPALLTPDQAASFLQVSTRTIRNLTARGILPVTRLSGKIVRYRRTDLEKCIESFTTGLR
jgi:excisionase family DNA binding protein